MTEEQKQLMGKALGRVVSGVYILTTRHGDQTSAMMASWVSQCSFDPPALAVAVAKGRPIAELILRSRKLALSIVSAEDKMLMKFYARLKAGDDPFSGVQIKSAPSGVPILSDALAWLDCSLIDKYDFSGDHDLFVAEVAAGEMLHDGTAFAHQRGNGFHY